MQNIKIIIQSIFMIGKNCTKGKCRISTFQKCMGLCVFDVYEKYYSSKTGGMSNIMGKNPTPLSPQGVKYRDR